MATTTDFHPVPANPAPPAPNVAAEPAKWHDDAHYIASPSGRLACATLGFALLSAAGLACFGNAANAPVAIAAVTLVCIMGGFLTIGLAMERHGTMALALVLSLPPVAGAYFALLHVLPGAGTAVGLGFLALTAIPIVASVLVHANAQTMRG